MCFLVSILPAVSVNEKNRAVDFALQGSGGGGFASGRDSGKGRDWGTKMMETSLLIQANKNPL